MKTSIYILVMAFMYLNVCATQLTDSLLVSLEKSEKEQRVDILCDLCWEFRFINSDSAFIFGNMALELSKRLDYARGIAQSYNDLGILFLDRGEYTNALKYFDNSLTIRKYLNDSSGIGSLYNKIGIVYQKKGQLKASLENAILALEIYENLNEELWVGYCLNNIAIINYNLGNLSTSLEYHQRALELRIKRGDKYGEAGSYSNIANVNLEMGDTAQAIKNYERALNLSQELNLKEPVSVILTNLGSVFLFRMDLDKALTYLTESLKIREELGDKKAISSSTIKIGQVYALKENYPESEKFLYRGLSLAKEVGIIEEERQAYIELSNLYSLKNNLDSSYKYLNLYSVLTDSVYENRLQQQIIETQAKYDSEKKDRDLAILRNENEINEYRLKQRRTEILLLIFIIISLVGAGIFLIYRRKQQQQRALDMARIEHNEQQIKAVLEGQEEERRKIARELHDGVGQSLSGVKLKWESFSDKLDNQKIVSGISELTELLDKAAGEIRTISHQMLPKELEQFGLVSALKGVVKLANESSDIEYTFTDYNIKQRLNTDIELAIFRIVQELISNVSKHSKASEVTIQLLIRNNNLVFIMEDNGIGFDYDKFKGKGIGLLNIETRVSGIKGKLNYHTSIGNGTIVTIRVPL